MTHPVQEQLALFAGGDLSAWRNWRVARHLHACQECSAEVEGYRGAAQTTRQLRELPSELDWGSLALEMKANIRLGLAAAFCVVLLLLSGVAVKSFMPTLFNNIQQMITGAAGQMGSGGK